MRLILLLLASSLFAAEHKIKPGDDPQAVMDAALHSAATGAWVDL